MLNTITDCRNLSYHFVLKFRIITHCFLFYYPLLCLLAFSHARGAIVLLRFQHKLCFYLLIQIRDFATPLHFVILMIIWTKCFNLYTTQIVLIFNLIFFWGYLLFMIWCNKLVIFIQYFLSNCTWIKKKPRKKSIHFFFHLLKNSKKSAANRI